MIYTWVLTGYQNASETEVTCPYYEENRSNENDIPEINKTYALLYFCYLQLFKGGITV